MALACFESESAVFLLIYDSNLKHELLLRTNCLFIGRTRTQCLYIGLVPNSKPKVLELVSICTE